MQIRDYTGGYEIKSYRALNSGALEGNIYFNGRRVLAVENSGRGGCNRYSSFPGVNTAEALAEFCAYAAEYFGEVEPEDQLVSALAEIKRAAAFAKRHNQTLVKVMGDLIADCESHGADGFYELDAKYFRHVVSQMEQ